MCVVCVEWEKGKLTNKEAKMALFEMVQVEGENRDHLQKAYATIDEKDRQDKLKEGAD